jgi:predicted phosphate transport protein (TIGR00153 family)
VRFRLVPSNDEFFAVFSDAARNLATCVGHLATAVADPTRVAAEHQQVKACERKGDEFTRDLLRRLDSTFVTPFDREDIHALAEGIDDVVDDVYHLSELLYLVPTPTILPELVEQADVLMRMAAATVELIDHLAAMKGMRPMLDEIDSLESQGDQIYRRTVARLFSGELPALEVLKWKDIIQSAEDAIDAIEDVADTVASILVKHA